MSDAPQSEVPAGLAIEPFQPQPDTLYSLDVTARLGGASRRSLLIYCRAGLVRPAFLPPYGIMVFTEGAIRTVRRIEQLRTAGHRDLAWIKSAFALLDEVERLRVELRFLRAR